uniref:Cadherin domain-containing protein n=1 Tax=Rodentolepis nana TaxID=102285 RepID=A0A0R3TE33_RODNA
LRPATQWALYKDLQQLDMTVESSAVDQAEFLEVDVMTGRLTLKPKTGQSAHAVFAMTVSQAQIPISLANPILNSRHSEGPSLAEAPRGLGQV